MEGKGSVTGPYNVVQLQLDMLGRWLIAEKPFDSLKEKAAPLLDPAPAGANPHKGALCARKELRPCHE